MSQPWVHIGTTDEFGLIPEPRELNEDAVGALIASPENAYGPVRDTLGIVLNSEVRPLLYREPESQALNATELAAAKRAIDLTLYGVMCLSEGVYGRLDSDKYVLGFSLVGQVIDRITGDVLHQEHLDTEVCGSYSGWARGEYGADISAPKL